MKRILISILAAVFCAFAAKAELRMPAMFSDGMVLQQKCQAAIWGKADAGSSVTVSSSWTKAKSSCKADEEGNWVAFLETPEASYTQYSICISCGKKEKITINDVLIGEVWLASGQSNMEMPMRGFNNCPTQYAQDYITAGSMQNRIRMFSVPKTQSECIEYDVKASWKGANPSTIAEMSATAFFFAHKLTEVLDVPVGILLSAYGGARVEGWTPKDLLETFPEEDLSAEAIAARNHMHKPYYMYNAMLAPLRGYAIKGFIWYQGCSNVGAAQYYENHLCKMVERWRRDWTEGGCTGGMDLPFYQVEIAPYSNYGDEAAMALREAQHKAAKSMGKGGIAVTNDLVAPYEAANIHPCRKKEVGDRLAFLALNKDYGYSELACDAPEVAEAGIDSKGRIALKLERMSSGLDRTVGIEGLEVKDAAGQWHQVSTADYNWKNRMLTIDCTSIEHPVEVRYGWGAYRPGNLHNGYGLPLTPFSIEIR